MAKAATELGLHFNSFKKRALELDCYMPNQSGKGINKAIETKIPLSEILAGKHPHFQTFKLKRRILKEDVLQYRCKICGISDWNGQTISLELDHIDGNSRNHKLNNLRLICPNCHSQTSTFRAKNKSKKNLSAPLEIVDAELLKFGETSLTSGNPEPSPIKVGKV
jgi:hypothetical protein